MNSLDIDKLIFLSLIVDCKHVHYLNILPLKMASRKNGAVVYKDNHTVFVTELGPEVTTDQLSTAVASFFYQCEKHYKKDRNYWGRWKVNIATNRDGISIGVGYIFFIKSEAYYAIIGKNLDGTKRVRKIPNPEFKGKEEKEKKEAGEITWDVLSATSFSCSWADMIPEDEEPEFIDEEIKGTVVPFPKIKLSDSQAERCENREITPLIRPCIAYDPPKDVTKYTLFARNLPTWVTEGEIKALFSTFVTNPADLEKGFPKVTIMKQSGRNNRNVGKHKNGFFNNANSPEGENDWRVKRSKKEPIFNKVFVKFNSYGNDSMFALVMTKKVKIKGVGRDSDKTVELFFNYAIDNGF